MEYMQVNSKWELFDDALYHFTSKGWVLSGTKKTIHEGYYNYTMTYYFERKKL